MEEIAAHPRVAAAVAHIDATDADTIDHMIEVTRIPAPSGAESARGAWLSAKLAALGLDVAPPDAVGNIRALRRGHPNADTDAGTHAPAPIMLASHLDTVFGAATDLTVRRDANRIHAPGISDNGRGLAALIRLASALHAAAIVTRIPLEFVGSVGEEGAGDLRGVKYIFADTPRCSAFIAVDGAGLDRIVHRAVGSRRLRITVNGPGGHSWIDRGTVHPVHALAAAISIAATLPSHPESSFSVGRIDGGTGINVLPVVAFADVDIRSENGGEIERIESGVRAAVERAIDSANANTSHQGRLTYHIESIGDRPGGATPADAPVVRHAIDATSFCGHSPELTSSSTDANVAMSLGIPSIAIGAGGDAGGMHTTDEWYSNKDGAAGIKRLLLLVIAMAGVV
jgi:acetylornithine deacetylase/succinyl-diaminopimelate desuccinylase-like protein